jgi:hypothetical protein
MQVRRFETIRELKSLRAKLGSGAISPEEYERLFLQWRDKAVEVFTEGQRGWLEANATGANA